MSYAFDAEKHVHTFDGKRMYGVTSILKAWGDKSQLINWSANCAVDYILENQDPDTKGGNKVLITTQEVEQARTAHTRKRDKAGDKGTEVHKFLEDSLNKWIETGTANWLPENAPEVVAKVLNWMQDNNIKPLKSEMPVYSLEHFYAGIADGVIEKDGKKYILDFKTSGYVYTTAFFQMGAYSNAIKEMKKGAEIAGCVVVHIPRGTSFTTENNVYWMYNIEELERGFLNILSTYKTDKELEKLIKW